MDNFIMDNFITVVAWVFGIGNAFLIIAKRITEARYPASLDNTFDRLRGIKRIWEYENNIVVVLLCVCWLISRYL